MSLFLAQPYHLGLDRLSLNSIDDQRAAIGAISNTDLVNALAAYTPTASLAPVALSGSATHLTTGTLADERLSSNVPLKNANNTFSGLNTFSGNVSTPRVYVSGSNPQISPLTSDGSDNRTLILMGGGEYGPTTRGPHITLAGLEAATRPGNIELWSGLNGEIRLGGEQGGGHTIAMTVTAAGVTRLATDRWHQDMNGAQRLYYWSADRTIIKGHGSQPIEFRNAADNTIGYYSEGVGWFLAGAIAPGNINFPANVWMTATDGLQRLYYTSSGTSLYRGHGTTPHQFRNGADSVLAQLSSGGTFTTTAGISSIDISGGITTLSSSIAFGGNGHLALYSGGQIYLGDNNFRTSGYWNSAPGIGAVGGPPTSELAFYVYTGNVNSRTEAGRFKTNLGLQLGGTVGNILRSSGNSILFRNNTDSGKANVNASGFYGQTLSNDNDGTLFIDSPGATLGDMRFRVNAALQEAMSITYAAQVRFRNGNWHGSITDGLDRFLFTASGTSYWKGHGAGTAIAHEWRNGSDEGLLFLLANGNFGVRTSTPAARLEVASVNAGSSTRLGFRIDSIRSNSDGEPHIRMVRTGVAGWNLAQPYINLALYLDGNSAAPEFEFGQGGFGAKTRITVNRPDGVTGCAVIESPSWDNSYVAIRHANQAQTAATTALQINANGVVGLNASTGQSLALKIGNVEQLTFASSLATFAVPIQLGSGGPKIQQESGVIGFRSGAGAYTQVRATEYRLDANSFSRVAQLDTASGAWGGGYNFNLNGGVANRDSSGTVSGVYYGISGVQWYAETSGAPGTITSRMTLTPTTLAMTGAITATGNITATGRVNSGNGTSFGESGVDNAIRANNTYIISADGGNHARFTMTSASAGAVFRLGWTTAHGGVSLESVPVASGQTGYLAWFKPSGPRQGYIGYDGGNDITLKLEQAGGQFVVDGIGARIGSSGPLLKNSSGTLQVRNSADSAFANVEAGGYTTAGLILQDVSSNGQVSAIRARNSNNGNAAQTRIELFNDEATTSTTGASLFLCSSTFTGGFARAAGLWNHQNGPLLLATNNVERMRIDAAGLVNILQGTLQLGSGVRLKNSGNRLFVRNDTDTAYAEVRSLRSMVHTGLHFLDQTTETEHWFQYKIGGDPKLYIRDIINSRMHVTYTAGVDAVAALTQFHSRLNIDGQVRLGDAVGNYSQMYIGKSGSHSTLLSNGDVDNNFVIQMLSTSTGSLFFDVGTGGIRVRPTGTGTEIFRVSNAGLVYASAGLSIPGSTLGIAWNGSTTDRLTLNTGPGGRFIIRLGGVDVVDIDRDSQLASSLRISAGNSTFAGHVTSAFQTLSADPSTIDIPSGSHRLVKNTTSGEIRDWVNDGGVMKKSQAYT